MVHVVGSLVIVLTNDNTLIYLSGVGTDNWGHPTANSGHFQTNHVSSIFFAIHKTQLV